MSAEPPALQGASPTADEPLAVGGTSAGAVLTRPAAPGTWPCTACAADNALTRPACETCGLPFLAGARDSEPLLVLPLVGDLTALSQARRIRLALAVVAAFVVLCTVLGLLLA